MIGASVSDLKARTVNAIKWSYFSTFTNMFLTLFFSAILSRLLTKEQFGIWATAMLLQRFGQFIADLGIGQAIVQKAKLTEDDIRAGLTSSVSLGLLATGLAWLIAPAAADYFNKPDLVEVFRGYACVYVLSAGNILSASLLRRALKFKPLITAELSSYIIGHGIIGLTAAYLGYGAMALVASAISQAIIQLVLLYSATRHTLKPIFRPSAFRGLYTFGMKATVVNFLEFISASLDTFLISKFYPSAALGAYDRTFNTLAKPATNFAMSLSRVLAPSFSAVQDEPDRLRRAYLSGLRAMSLVIFTAAGCLIVDAPEIVRVMLGEQFLDSVQLMQTFALFIPFAVLTNLSAVMAEATARLNVKIAIQAIYFVALASAFWITYRAGGQVEALAAVLVVAAMIRSAAYAVVARNIIGGSGRQIALTYLLGGAFFVGAGLVNAAVVFSLRAIHTPLAVLFVTELIVGGLLVAGVVLYGPPSELQSMARASLKQIRGRLIGTAG